MEERPTLSTSLQAEDLHKWYWLKDEFIALAKLLNISTGGSKQELTERLALALSDGQDRLPVSRKARSNRKQLAEPLDLNTVIPEGQRCSQVLRVFFKNEIGPTFHFDQYMRDFIDQGAGRTLQEAVQHWYSTREQAAQPKEIGPQFEYNRFTRQWFAEHPKGTREEALAAWRDYRSKPRSL